MNRKNTPMQTDQMKGSMTFLQILDMYMVRPAGQLVVKYKTKVFLLNRGS